MEQKLIYYSRLRLEFEALVVQKKIFTQAQLEKNEKGDYSNIVTEAVWIGYKLRSIGYTFAILPDYKAMMANLKRAEVIGRNFM